MSPTLQDLVPANCTQFVPSLVAPTRTVMVEHLFTPSHPLSPQDLYIMQRTVLAPGQQWLYMLQDMMGMMQCVQLTMVDPPSLRPTGCLQSQVPMMPPMMPPPGMPQELTETPQERGQPKTNDDSYFYPIEGDMNRGP